MFFSHNANAHHLLRAVILLYALLFQQISLSLNAADDVCVFFSSSCGYFVFISNIFLCIVDFFFLLFIPYYLLRYYFSFFSLTVWCTHITKTQKNNNLYLLRIGWWFCLFFTYKLHSNFKARTTRSAQINRLKIFTTANTKYWTADCEWVCVYFVCLRYLVVVVILVSIRLSIFFNCVFVLFFARFFTSNLVHSNRSSSNRFW